MDNFSLKSPSFSPAVRGFRPDLRLFRLQVLYINKESVGVPFRLSAQSVHTQDKSPECLPI